MAKIEYRKLSEDQRRKLEIGLRSSLINLPGKKDIVSLLFDLLTPSERIMIARRVLVASRLLRGKSYIEIRHELNASFDMIKHVDVALDEKLNSYRVVIPEIIAKQKKRLKSSSSHSQNFCPDSYSIRTIRNKYPAHFALINLLLHEK